MTTSRIGNHIWLKLSLLKVTTTLPTPNTKMSTSSISNTSSTKSKLLPINDLVGLALSYI